MQQRKKKRLDNFAIGMLAGFILPVIVFFAVYFISENGTSFSNYVGNLMYLQALVKLGSLCVFANSAVFMLFIKMKHDKTARGILGATILYAMAVMISQVF
jgi:hypothetical protein